MEQLIATTVVGSYPQPDWLVDRAALVRRGVPRVRADEIWRIPPEHRAEAVEAATLVAIADQEAAGVDIITDGEIGRESYFNHFAIALDGIDPARSGSATNRAGTTSEVPLVSGPIRRTRPIELDAARLLRANTSRATKVTIPGPFTLSQMAQNEYYPDQRSLALAYAAAIREELADLVDAGIDVLQIDEPYLQANAEAARDFAVEVVGASVEGIGATTVLHTCYGYAQYVADKAHGYPYLFELRDMPVDHIAIEAAQPRLGADVVATLRPKRAIVGVVDLSTDEVERPDDIARRIEALLAHIPPSELSVSPDCGMKFLDRSVASAKLAAMVEGAALVRAKVTGTA